MKLGQQLAGGGQPPQQGPQMGQQPPQAGGQLPPQAGQDPKQVWRQLVAAGGNKPVTAHVQQGSIVLPVKVIDAMPQNLMDAVKQVFQGCGLNPASYLAVGPKPKKGGERSGQQGEQPQDE